ncbi:glycosyl hydrolase family 28 protein [Ralstonia solanacearum]|uniref:Exo-poly-galacturonase signal peptide protein n=1 Tax=Ralstonia solanacearum TaxID=305 RepID=A0AAD0WF00_RALSL|nr:glycoside hydrolase family 28 protein [Ralstonia solanacearum]AXV80253.1 exo-poly-galacturonase signal peptide protein [Ralstonia solanacearum]AXW51398.1 exo-poly-galacturonase signal peptide protein [Ralstonia solanacearum]
MRQRGMSRGVNMLLAAILTGVLASCGSSEDGGTSGLSVSGESAPTASTTSTNSTTCSAVNVRAANGTRSTVPQNPCVPALSYDDTSITLAWNKPDIYADVVDYNVYLNGKKLGSASENNAAHSVARRYIDRFYAEDTAGFHTRMTFHSFHATGLTPDTAYLFTVRAVDRSGQESADSVPVSHKTAPAFTRIYNVAKLGAMGNGTTLNTAVIQKAIDECASTSATAYGCKVLIPADDASGTVFVTGALFLRSNMTLEIAEGATLRGSSDAADYPLAKGYQLYSYFTNATDDRRPPSLLNALSPAHMNGRTALADHQGYDDTRGVFSNIRITGKGTLDGSGWMRSSTDTIDEVGNRLANFAPGNASKWSTLGVLAKNQMLAAQTEAGGTLDSTRNANYYSNRRSSLATFRGASNLYFGDLTLTNPAFHGVMFVESENVVFANTVTQTFDINNADGVEFGDSSNAVVFNNFIDSGDDNINFGAGQGKNYEGIAPQQYAWIFNNYMREGHGGVVAGSHTGAWIEDMLAEDNVMFMTDNGLRLKSTPATGGGARRIVFRDTAMREVGTKNRVTAGGQTFTNNTNGNPFILTLSYSAGSNVFESASASARFRDITVNRVTVDNGSPSTGGAMIAVDGYDGTDTSLGYPETFHENVLFQTVKINNARPASISRLKDSTFKDVTITNWGASATPWAISNTSGLTFSNVTPTP